MSFQNRFIFGVLSGAGSVIVKTALNIILIPVILHMLGADLYGLYVLLFGVLELVILMDLGFTSAIVKLLGGYRSVDDDENALDLLKTSHWLYIGITIITLGIGVLLIPFFPQFFSLPSDVTPIAQVSVAIVLVEGLLTLYTNYYKATLFAHSLHQWVNLGDTVYSVAGNILGFVLLFQGFGLEGLMVARLVAAGIRTGMLIGQAKNVEPQVFNLFGKVRFKSFKSMAHLSFHAMMVDISVQISHKIDSFVIAYFLPLRYVGIYEIVFRFLSVTIQIGLKVCEGVLPLFTRMSSMERKDDARELFLRMSCFSNFVSVTLLMLIVSFYPHLFHLLSDDKIPIEQTYPVLWVAVPIMWTGALQMPAGPYLFAHGHQKFLTISSLVAAFANLILSLLLVKPYGLVGVALGTLIPQIIQHQASLIREVCKELAIGFKQYVYEVHIKVLPAAIIAFAWVMLLRWLLIDITPFQLLNIVFIGFTTTLLASFVWFVTTATPRERELVNTKILPRIKGKFSKKEVEAQNEA